MLNIKKKKISKKYIIIIIVIIVMLIFAIFSYTLKNNRQLNKFEGFFKDTIVNVGGLITYPIRYVINSVSDFNELKNIKKENDNLRTSLERIESIETENVELRRQLESLKDELNIEYTLTDYEYLNATVVSRNVGYWFNTVTIDKGTYAGVDVDMIVINAKGLIGRIISTTTFTSTVRLLTTTDTNNKISVTIISNNNKLNGLINKYDYDTNTLEIEGISNTEVVSIGDIIYTSGLGGIFPSGILIGKVDSITTDSYDLAKIINVTPSADFNDINYVSILKRKDTQ